MSEKEKKRLNGLGRSILAENGIILKEDEDYNFIRSRKGVGYANHYLVVCWDDSKKISKAHVSTYRELVDIDSKLGTNASLQLLFCLNSTTRSDLIKVRFFVINTELRATGYHRMLQKISDEYMLHMHFFENVPKSNSFSLSLFSVPNLITSFLKSMLSGSELKKEKLKLLDSEHNWENVHAIRCNIYDLSSPYGALHGNPRYLKFLVPHLAFR